MSKILKNTLVSDTICAIVTFIITRVVVRGIVCIAPVLSAPLHMTAKTGMFLLLYFLLAWSTTKITEVESKPVSQR